MRKLCLAVFSLCLFISNAYADLYAEFVRIECNQDLGLLDISRSQLHGSMIAKYLNVHPVYKYKTSLEENNNHQSEIVLIGDLIWQNEKNFKYHCQLMNNTSYDIDISLYKSPECDEWENSYKLNIIKNGSRENNPKQQTYKVIEDVTLGCLGANSVQFLGHYESWGPSVHVILGVYDVVFQSDDIDKPITDEDIETNKQVILKEISNLKDNSN